MTSWRARFSGIGVTVILLAGACTGSTGGPTTVESDAPEANDPQEVRFVAVDYAYTEVPEEIRAGVIDLTFENQGSFGHEATLSEIGHTPLDQFVKDLGGRYGLEGLPFPEYIDQVAVPSFVSVAGGETGHAGYTLTEGRYALWCSIDTVPEGEEPTPHYQLGMVREVIVVAGDDDPQLPEADGAITARDYSFDIDIEAGDRTINFLNEGPDQVHLSTVEVFPEGVDAVEAERAVEARLEPGPPPKDNPSTTGLGYSGIFSTGLGSTFELYQGGFESGRTYLFLCFVPDREGGKPHFKAYNMYKIVTIE